MIKQWFSPLVKRIAVLLVIAAVLAGGVLGARYWVNQPKPEKVISSVSESQSEKVSVGENELEGENEPEGESEPRPDQPDKALEFRKLQLQDENGLIPADGLVKAAQQIKAMQANIEDGPVAGIARGTWTWLGPGNVGGRVRSLVIHPTNPNIIWAGSVTGGIWKSTDAGVSWQVLDDFMTNMAVASMIIDPTNPNVLYAGTGEGFYNLDGLQGAGVFKTTDGGTTWTQLSATNTSNWYYVNRLAISPDGTTILAATQSGIWRSTDGGTTWSQKSLTETLDINFNPADGTKAVASGNNKSAWYSTDGGVTWNAATFTAGISGSTSYIYRIETAYAPSNPSIVYASIDVNGGEVWKSTDGGVNYAKMGGANYLQSQGWYDNIIWVDPTDANKLVVGGIDLWRSTTGGTSFTKISNWQLVPASAHADQHVIIQDPGFNGTSNAKVYFGNDGGVYRADNVNTVSTTTGWTELNNNLGITQFYGAAGNPTTGEIIGGTQDNGTLFYTSAGGTEGWTRTYGGDGGFSAADPTDPNYFYGEYVYLNLHRSSNRGASASYIYSGITDAATACANFIAPFILDPNNPNTMLAGGCSLWRSTNVKAATPSWASIKPSGADNISAIAVAPGNSDIIWVGYNNGDVYKTINGTNASPTWTRVDTTTPTLPNRYVTRITVDKDNNNVVYVTLGGFSPDNIWRTANGGTNWTDITGSGLTGIPDLPVRSLVINPNNANWLYVGTELGIFTSVDGGANWTLPHEGPTNTSVDELFWLNPTTLIAASYGRGLYKNVLDTTAPAAPIITAPANGSSTNDTTPTVSGTAEANSTVKVYFDSTLSGSTAANGSGNWSYTPASALAVSAHTVKATATDASSNTSGDSATNTFTVDITVPAAPVITDPANSSSTNDTTPTVSGTAEANSTVRVYFDNVLSGSTTADGSGNWSYTPSSALAGGAHTVKATATDAANNTSGDSNANTFTVNADPGTYKIYLPFVIR
jgi:hypothetical protein